MKKQEFMSLLTGMYKSTVDDEEFEALSDSMNAYYKMMIKEGKTEEEISDFLVGESTDTVENGGMESLTDMLDVPVYYYPGKVRKNIDEETTRYTNFGVDLIHGSVKYKKINKDKKCLINIRTCRFFKITEWGATGGIEMEVHTSGKINIDNLDTSKLDLTVHTTAGITIKNMKGEANVKVASGYVWFYYNNLPKEINLNSTIGVADGRIYLYIPKGNHIKLDKTDNRAPDCEEGLISENASCLVKTKGGSNIHIKEYEPT